MANIAIELLWVLFWIVVCAGVLWLFIYGIKTFIYAAFPPKLEQGVWFLFLILCIIAVITIFAGGGGMRVPHVF